MKNVAPVVENEEPKDDDDLDDEMGDEQQLSAQKMKIKEEMGRRVEL